MFIDFLQVESGNYHYEASPKRDKVLNTNNDRMLYNVAQHPPPEVDYIIHEVGDMETLMMSSSQTCSFPSLLLICLLTVIVRWW